ncbi:hypothetical protein X975_12655, partial [Stegodyphus mimosarum]
MIQKDAWNDNESQAQEFPNALIRDPSSFHNIIKTIFQATDALCHACC